MISLGTDAREPRATGRDLRRVIHGVRRRFRLRLALRGLAITLGFGLVALGLSAWGMDHFRYTATAITAFRIFTWTALAGLIVRYLALPLFVRLPDERVALYVEEHDPSLQAALLSAVELGPERVERERPDVSPELSRRLVEQAEKRCEEIDYRRLVERRSLQRMSGLLSGVATAGMLAALVSPAFVRHAVPFLLAPWNTRGANPYSIRVEPGHATLARGADQGIVAHLDGFDSDEVQLAVQRGDGKSWERWPMTVEPGQPGHRFMLLDVAARTEYFVEANGVRSELYRLDVADVPYVDRIDLQYRFPEYTGLAPEPVEDGGDVAALRGTRIELRVTTTVPVPSGRLVVEGEPPRPLERAADGTLGGSFEVARNAFYRIELPSADGRLQAGSPDYKIDVLEDQPPLIRMLKPGRDAQVTSIEEVFTEVEAEDDFGLTKLELVYSIGGAPEKTVPLHQGRGQKRLSAGHTFFLEEHKLEPGDFVSYFARATDNRGAPGRQQSTTDIYFMEVRPFDRAYRQAAEQPGGAGAGGGEGDTLSRQQREIVAATFKLRRDKGRSEPRQLDQDVATLALVQGRLREQVENLNRRMQTRGVTGAGSEFGNTAESLQQAAVEMAGAVKELEARRLDGALVPEQRALQHLQRAEAAFRDVQVAFGQQGGGGGGGATSAEELSDLFELELDKLENQYEAVRRGESQRLDQAVDEAMQRLRELARRQEQEVERQRLRAQGSGGGQSEDRGRQRRLAEEAEELGRRLERLAREHETPGLSDTANRLKQAADSMRRAGAGGDNGALSQGLSALERLKDARRTLEQSREDHTRQDIERAVDLAEGIARDQQKIADEVQRLGDGRGEGAAERVQRLDERKDALAGQVQSLEQQLDRMAGDTRASSAPASRALRDAASGIRENKLKEKIRYSKGVVRGRPGEPAQQFESEIGKDIDQLARQVAEAAQKLGEAKGDPRASALERTRDVVQRLESLQERLKQGPAGTAEGDSSQGGARASREAGLPGGTSSGGGASPGVTSWNDGESRQLRRELRQRAEDVQGIGSQLAQRGNAPGDLREIERKLRRLERVESWGNPRGVEALVGQTLEDLKLFEYALRREVAGADPEKLRLSGSDEVPEGWRSLVEEYYRLLGRDGK